MEYENSRMPKSGDPLRSLNYSLFGTIMSVQFRTCVGDIEENILHTN